MTMSLPIRLINKNLRVIQIIFVHLVVLNLHKQSKLLVFKGGSLVEVYSRFLGCSLTESQLKTVAIYKYKYIIL